MKLAALAVSVAAAYAAPDVPLVRFDGAEATTRSWRETNDPVMGGQSTGGFAVDGDGQVGIFDGEVVNVPKLQAPGFIKVDGTGAFPDVSHCSALKLTLKASEPYAGYRVSFGNGHPIWGKFFAWGYKANFQAPVGDFGEVTIPFDDFSDYWDDATGEAIETCKENKIYCPPEGTLRNMKTLGFWGEGVAGQVHLEIKSVAATGCGEEVTAPRASGLDFIREAVKGGTWKRFTV